MVPQTAAGPDEFPVRRTPKTKRIDGGWKRLPVMKLTNSIAGAAMAAAALSLTPSLAHSEGAGVPRADAGNPSARHPAVEIAAGRMSAHLQTAPVSEVLKILAQKTRARIVFHGAMQDTLTAEFKNRSVEEGLQRVFRGRNIAYFYAAPAAGMPRRLFQVIILDASGGIADFDPPAEGNLGEELRISAEHEAGIIAELARVIEQTEDREERARAVRQLGKTWSADAVAPLAQVLARDESASVREAAAGALGRTWSEKAVQPLIDALAGDPDALVREQAARALAETAGEEAVLALAQSVAEDRRWFVREAAAAALGAIGGRDALDALAAPAAADRDGWVREAATLAVLDHR
jgi:hypothetical protein